MAFDDDSIAPAAPDDEPAVDAVDEVEPTPHVLEGYWAAKSGSELANAILQKEADCHEIMRQREFGVMYRLAYAQKFGQDPMNPGSFDTQQIGFEGAHGEQLRFRVNEPMSFLNQQVTMATGQRAAFLAVAKKTDSATIAMAPVIDAAVDNHYRREMPDSKERALLTNAKAYAAAYAWWRWEKWAGDDVQVGVEQIPIPNDPEGATAPVDVFGPSGAPVATLAFPWDEFHDPWQRGRRLWRGVRERRSKWELMAIYPEHATVLRGLQGETSALEDEIFGTGIKRGDDDIVVRHFYHEPMGDPNDQANPLRTGLYAVVVKDLVLLQERLPTSRETGMPIVELMPVQMDDVAFGVSSWWDLLAIQQGEDAVVSDILSNAHTFGRQSMFYEEGTDLDLDQMARGGGVFMKPSGAQNPGFMQPAPMSPTAPWLVEHFSEKKQAITGLNATARGNPSPNITSGEMAALFTNLAVEFNSGDQMALDEARRRSASIISDLILLNATNDMLVQMSGVDDRPYIDSFRTEALKGVRGFEMQTTTPMMRSQAGRMQLFNLIKDIDDEKQRAAAVILITTGQWRQITQTDSAKYIRIKWENEQLAKGIEFPPPQPGMDPKMALAAKTQQLAAQLGVKVSTTDDPTEDLPQHVKLYNELSQDPQKNEKQIAAVMAHIQDHLDKYYLADPMLCALLKIPPPPQPGTAPAPAAPHGSAPPRGGKPAQLPGAGKGAALDNGDARPPSAAGPKLPEPAKPPEGQAA